MRFLKLIAVLSVVMAQPLAAQTRSQNLHPSPDPRGPVDLTICSQNLENYGLFPDVKNRVVGATPDRLAEKELALAQRMAKAGCDVIAVQEVLGKKEEQGQKALEQLAARLRTVTNRMFEAVVGPSNDIMLRNGYLIAKDKAEVVTRVSYYRVELPKLSEKERSKLFVRGPLELQIVTKPQGDQPAKTISLVTFHFKSKHGGQGDPAQLEWETYRMEMAEALRRILTNRLSRYFSSGESLLVVLGDRNSNFDAASAKILEGELKIGDFKGGGACRLSKRGVPLCQAGVSTPAALFSVLVGDPQTKLLLGTHRYKKEYSWLDEILMPAESLRAAWERFDSVGDYASGVIYEPKKASDHALVYVKLNW